MNTGVRIIKRGQAPCLQSPPVGPGEKTGTQREREIAATVKSWIAESAQRRSEEKQCAYARLKPVPL